MVKYFLKPICSRWLKLSRDWGDMFMITGLPPCWGDLLEVTRIISWSLKLSFDWGDMLKIIRITSFSGWSTWSHPQMTFKHLHTTLSPRNLFALCLLFTLKRVRYCLTKHLIIITLFHPRNNPNSQIYPWVWLFQLLLITFLYFYFMSFMMPSHSIITSW